MKKFLLIPFISIFILSLSASIFAASTKPMAKKPVAVKHVFGVHGLSCPFCVVGIKKTFKKIKGVQSVNVSLKHNTVTIYTNKGICFSDKELKKIFNKAAFSYHGTITKPKSCGKRS